ncbi:MAG: hypothetical protein KGM15_02965 [Pseudomonadota bacterium]|nr:hypothetical protein [Pseudomonadota bacterium]
MPTLDLFLPLTKVDVDGRMVHGVATAEAPDRAGEICDYDSTKPYFEAWASNAREASAGKSLGAVRAMHQRIAAGKLTDIAFDDDDKRILVSAKIVDDDEWEKVVEGVYTGFSQGGRYVKRWADETSGLTRYTAEPSEISLVDVPCLPGATFQVVKDGIVEERAFADAPQTVKTQESPAPEPVAPPPPPEAPQASSSQALTKAALALASAADKLEKAIEENSRLRAALDLMTPQFDALAKRIGELEAQPLPPKAALRAASREWDGGHDGRPGGVEAAIKTISELPENERTMALMKVSLANPRDMRL